MQSFAPAGARAGGPPPGSWGRGLRDGTPPRRWPILNRWSMALSVALSLVVSGVTARADVYPRTMNGVPLLPVPTFEEVGLPEFTAPTGTPSTGADMSATEAGAGGAAAGGTGDGADGAFVAASWSQYEGQAVGSGQCVALVQAADPDVGLTRTWTQGAQVQGNTDLKPGTVIATFGPDGTYTNSLDGSSHAAIYLGQDATGIQVIDQWAGHPSAYRTIQWSSASGKAANTGSAFYAVNHAS